MLLLPGQAPADIFHTDIVVFPTNCITGVMGAGFALECARRFKGLRAIRERLHGLGQAYIPTRQFNWPSRPALLATKDNWRSPARLDWVQSWLYSLAIQLDDFHESLTVGVPALGCGLGGLAWADVRLLLENFANCVHQPVALYPPRS